MPDWLHKIQNLHIVQRRFLGIAVLIILYSLTFLGSITVIKKDMADINNAGVKITAVQTREETRTLSQNQTAAISPAGWFKEALIAIPNSFAFVFFSSVSGIAYVLNSSIDAIGALSDTLAGAEEKFVPGFGNFMAGVITPLAFWR